MGENLFRGEGNKVRSQKGEEGQAEAEGRRKGEWQGRGSKPQTPVADSPGPKNIMDRISPSDHVCLGVQASHARDSVDRQRVVTLREKRGQKRTSKWEFHSPFIPTDSEQSLSGSQKTSVSLFSLDR